MENTELLKPAVVLIGWTIIILFWLYARRIPAMRKAKIKPNDSLDQDLSAALPLSARQVAANYNHLLEQPVIFYALVLSIAVMGHIDQIHVWCAWAYVGLRIVHSLIQVIYHNVMHRWGVFMLSSLVLVVMVVNELLKLFG